ncbi:MAG TPA: methyltransferase domain-containing protein [Solirubrobacterales bacterium]
MYEESIRDEFTHQTDSFATSAAMSGEDVLGGLVALAPADSGTSWLETACGPGLISRALAARVGSVHGVDLTPAMVERARDDALAEGIENVEFSLGDATALEFEDAAFDGAATRLSLHHIPAPQRVVAEMARVVRPGRWVVVGDHITDPDPEAMAWHQEIERLRDPSHWSCLTQGRLRRLGEEAGLTLDSEQLTELDLDYDDWLARGSAGPAAAALIDRLLTEAPDGVEAFRVVQEGESRRLKLRFWLSRWRR